MWNGQSGPPAPGNASLRPGSDVGAPRARTRRRARAKPGGQGPRGKSLSHSRCPSRCRQDPRTKRSCRGGRAGPSGDHEQATPETAASLDGTPWRFPSCQLVVTLIRDYQVHVLASWDLAVPCRPTVALTDPALPPVEGSHVVPTPSRPPPPGVCFLLKARLWAGTPCPRAAPPWPPPRPRPGPGAAPVGPRVQPTLSGKLGRDSGNSAHTPRGDLSGEKPSLSRNRKQTECPHRHLGCT